MPTPITAGVLALQGDYGAHAAMFERAGARPLLVRSARELNRIDVLAMPGGESTTMSMLLDRFSLRAPLADALNSGLPTLATCAGMILCSREVAGDRGSVAVTPLGVMDTVTARNAYGRQVDSFETPLKVNWNSLGMTGSKPREFPGVFIRAPRVVRYGPRVEPVAWAGDACVAIRQGNIIAAAFHPELSQDPRFHLALLKLAG